jgi:hypothetical protein
MEVRGGYRSSAAQGPDAMRRTLALLVVALGLFSPGCSVVENGVRVVGTNMLDSVDDVREQHRNRKYAATAWKQIASADPDKYSPDHARGFVEGFADYLFSGKGDPPIIPPARYRGFRYQTPQGYQAIEDWFAGYRHGVAVAVDSGYRRLVTGPLSTTLPAGPPGVFVLPGEHVSVPAKLKGPTLANKPAPPANKPAPPAKVTFRQPAPLHGQSAAPLAAIVPARFGAPVGGEPDNPASIGLPAPPWPPGPPGRDR